MADRVPDVIGEIRGWRAWEIAGTPKLPFLKSVTHGNTIWHPDRWTVAECFGKDHCHASSDGRIPGESCSCGMYAAASREQLVGHLPYAKYREGGPKVVVGEVAFVGKVIPGSQGWRGEKARVVKLYVPFAFRGLMGPLEQLYRCEVVPDNTWSQVSTEQKMRELAEGKSLREVWLGHD